MKPYADYTKDDLMRMLESLTPGGSEFHEEPETCVERIRDHVHSVTKQVIARQKAEAERDRLLTAATGIYNEILLHAPNIISRSREFVRLAIALDAVAAGEVVDEKEGEPAKQ